MLGSFFIIFQNVFFAFTLIPLSTGTYYNTALMFFGNFMPFVAKICAITLALTLNFILGLVIRKSFKNAFKNKQIGTVSNKALLLLLFSFIPVISGIIAFYFGMLKINFLRFISIIFFINIIYYGLALNFPFLNIYF